MSTQIVGVRRRASLSWKRNPCTALVLAFGGLLPWAAGCQKIDSCEYRCTAVQNACPVGLECDITLGYCVSEDYNGTCDATTHEVTVCKDEPVTLELPEEAPSDPKDFEGLPASAAIEDGKLKAQFAKKAVFAFGTPDETRQYWHVDISDDCPVLDATLPPLCVGDTLSRTLAVSGGEGQLAFELLEKDANFTLSEDGVLAGKATLAGERELQVEVTDERGLNTVRSVKVAVSSECPDIRELPDSCAGTRYEVELGLLGKAPVRVTDFTAIQKDGKDLSSNQAESLVEQLALDVTQDDDRYVLSAAPGLEALGSYLLALKLENDLRIEQRNVTFDVKECSTVQADFSACQDQTFDFDLAGSPGDVWTFYDAEDPLDGPLSFVSDRRLRGRLPTPAIYEIRARAENAAEETDRVVTLTLAILSSSDPACNLEDAGVIDGGDIAPAPSLSEASSQPAPEDAAVPPVEEGDLGEGCVGRPYEFAVPLDGVASGTWNADNLPSGLTIDANGVVSGTPGATFEGVVNVTGSTGSGSVGNSFHLTVHAWCSVVFKGVPDGSTQTHLYQADRRPDVTTRDLSDDLTGDEEVTHFALSPDYEHVAFSVFDPYANTTRVVVKRRLALGTGQPETVAVGNITTTPFSEWVYELNWGTDRHLSLLVGPVPVEPDAGAESGQSEASIEQTFFVFDVLKNPPATTATQVLSKPTRDTRGLVWLDNLPCVTLADHPAPLPNTARESVCWKLSDGTSSTGAEIFNKYDTYRVRGHAGRFLQAHPFETGGIVLTSWMPNAPVGELAQVIHEATFASPLGDLVGTVRDTAMEIARTGDDTLGQSNAYTPLGLIDDCTTVDAWRAGGSLACSTGLSDPNEKVTIATPSGAALSSLPPFDAPGHSTSGRRIFLDAAYYVYDDLDGELNYVDLTASPLQVQAHNHGQGRRAVAMEALDGSRFVMQGPTALWVGVISAGTLGLTQVNGTGTPAAFSECEPAFGWFGFETWCGGDEISRRFQVAPDDDLGVVQSDSSNLELFSVSSTSQLKGIEDIRVSCGEHPYCLTEFQLAR